MNDDLLWLLLLIGFSAWLFSTILTVPLTLLLNHHREAPDIRRQQVLLVAALPWLGPLIGIVVALLPALLTLGSYLVDHCDVHGSHHPHLCFLHLPAIEIHIAQAVVLIMLFSVATMLCLRYCWREGMLYRRLHTVLQLAKTNTLVTVINSAFPTAFTAGVLKPRIIMDQCLRDALTLKERHAVIQHELAHIRTHDPMYNLLFEGLLLLHWPWVAHRLRKQWRQALEEQADAYVVQKSGNALALSEALLKSAKLRSQLTPSIPLSLLSMQGGDMAERIQRLLNPAPYKQSHINWNAAALVVVGILLLLSPTLHHGLETFLGYLVTGRYH